MPRPFAHALRRLAPVAKHAWPVTLVVASGLALSSFAALGTIGWEQARYRMRFERLAGTVSFSLRRSIEDSIEVLYDLRGDMALTRTLSRPGFRAIAKAPLAYHPGILALEWVPRVPSRDRSGFESDARKAGFRGFRITDRDPRGRLVPAGPRDEYYPVYFVEPLKGNERALGYAPRLPERDQAIRQARDTGKAAASERFALIQDAGTDEGVAIFLPCYPGGRGADHLSRPLGMLEGVFRLDTLVHNGLRGFHLDDLHLRLEDTSAPPDHRLLFATPGEPPSGSLQRAETFDVAGRRWSIRLFPREPNPVPLQALGMFLIGALVSLSAGAYLRSLQQQRAASDREAQASRELANLKNQFVNAISHDLRTPLTSIIGYLEFLEDDLAGPLTPGQREYVAQIEKGTTRLERLVDDLLDFARIEAGTFRLSVEPVDLVAKIRSVLKSLQPQAKDGRIDLQADLPEHPLVLQLDPARIERVLLNLIGNALKFTPAGGRIQAKARETPTGVRVEISDTGPGIAPEDRPMLFRPFTQLAPGIQKRGTGLGLSICKSLIEAHGGEIGLSSAPGQGCLAWFTLPRAETSGPPHA